MSHPVRQLRYRVQRRSSKRVTVKIVALAKEAPCDSGPPLQARLGGGVGETGLLFTFKLPFFIFVCRVGYPR